MREELRKKYRRNYIVRFLIGNTYEVPERHEEAVDDFLRNSFGLLEPRHRDDMIAHYLRNESRTAQVAQNIMHGRPALRAVLNSQDSLDQLKELCYEKSATD